MPVTKVSFSRSGRKLGLSADKLVPFEEVLREFIGLFQGPLPAHIVASLNAILDLDDENSDLLHKALLQHVETAVADLATLNEKA